MLTNNKAIKTVRKGVKLLIFKLKFKCLLLMSLSQSFARDLQLHRILDPKTFEAFVHVPMVNEREERRFPLLLFLHGGCQSGEGGPELERLIYDSTAPLLDLAQGTAIPSFARRFVVVAPQSRWEEFTIECSRNNSLLGKLIRRFARAKVSAAFCGWVESHAKRTQNQQKVKTNIENILFLIVFC